MLSSKNNQGAVSDQRSSTLKGRQATFSIPRVQYVHERVAYDQSIRAFMHGAIFGALVASFVFLAILWLWIIPTMDSAVATVQAVAA